MTYSPSDSTQALTNLLGITYPIIQAPTGGVAIPALTAAVSNAGAFGGTALTWSDLEAAKSKIEAIQARTSSPFYVNYVLNFDPVSLYQSLDMGVHAVQFSWGLPTSEMVDSIKSTGTVLGIQVTSKTGALQAIELGADYLVCQGIEAGGHVQASTPLEHVLGEVLSVAGDIPVVVSGGIANGETMYKYIRLGAAGVVMGSRFVATQESGAHQHYKEALVHAQSDDTTLTICMNKGWDSAIHRILKNSTFNNWEAEGCPVIGQRPGEHDVLGSTSSNEPIERYSFDAPMNGTIGDIEAMCKYAGNSVNDIHDIPTVEDLVKRIWKEFSEG